METHDDSYEWFSMATKTPSILEPNISRQKLDEHTFPISDSVMLRVYSNTRPHNQKIACLQKGLILVVNGAETVGEGTGFGLPVLQYSRETFFSASSTVDVSTCLGRRVIAKQFSMDRVARNSFRNIALENHAARSLIDHLSTLYQNHPHFRFLTLKDLTGKIGIRKAFPETAPKGNVTITYTIDKTRIIVEADFTKLQRRGLRKIFMLNEQSARFFRKYTDSQGTELLDEKIGAWGVIGDEWACVKTMGNGLGFRLWKVEGSILRRGREFLQGSLDWVGLDYEVNPMCDTFRYVIEIVGL
jgi:hypothetical protein